MYYMYNDKYYGKFFYFTALLKQSVSSDNYLFVSVSEIVFLKFPFPHFNKSASREIFVENCPFLNFQADQKIEKILRVKRDPQTTME
jgi:hypothetical protein